MNERIEKLKKHAMIRVNNPTVNSNGKVICDNWEDGISLSKFAQLIVEECASIAREVGNSTDPSDFALDRCFEIEEKIKQHFGVEE
jgi:hypothetical protein